MLLLLLPCAWCLCIGWLCVLPMPLGAPLFRPAHPSSITCRLSVKPANPPADDPSCLTCYRAPSANARALVKFIQYAVQQPNVWFVTSSDLVRLPIPCG